MKTPSSDTFLRTAKAPPLSSADRVALIRRGNEMFNRGEYEMAERIYMTTKYPDGLIRIGGEYEKKGDFFEALRLYWHAGEKRKVEYMTKKVAQGIRYLLRDDSYKKLGEKTAQTESSQGTTQTDSPESTED